MFFLKNCFCSPYSFSSGDYTYVSIMYSAALSTSLQYRLVYLDKGKARFANFIYLCFDISQNLVMCKIIISKQNVEADFHITLCFSHRLIYFIQEQQCINFIYAANIPLFLYKLQLKCLT